MLEKCISCIRISNFFGGEDPDTPHGLHNFGARWVRLRPTWYRLPPQAKNPSYAPGLGECFSLEIVFFLCAFINALGPSCRLPTASPGRWIGGRPPDMVASCDLSGWPHLTNKQLQMEKDDKGSTMIRMGVSGWKFLLVPAYPGCPGSKAVKRSLLLLLFIAWAQCIPLCTMS